MARVCLGGLGLKFQGCRGSGVLGLLGVEGVQRLIVPEVRFLHPKP